MKLKQQYLDINIMCPFTNKIVNTTFIDPKLYPFYIKKGLGDMFEEEVKVQTTTKKPKTDDIS
jgi:hypothetical protein